MVYWSLQGIQRAHILRGVVRGFGAKVLTSGNPSCKYHERLWEEIILLTLGAWVVLLTFGNYVAYIREILVTSGNPSRKYFNGSCKGGQSNFFIENR